MSDSTEKNRERPRISVAMATFNGERFIAEQLQSILTQSIIPDEIIISDDGSTDATLMIVGNVLVGSAVEWKLVRNKYEKGYSTNFSNALEETTGDIVFLSDQDDIWLPEKVSTILQYFDGSDAELVTHDAQILWEDAGEDGPLMSEHLMSRGHNPENNIYGCMMVVRRSLLQAVLPLPEKTVGHDMVLSFFAGARSTRGYLDIPLIKYRRHSGNVTQTLFSERVYFRNNLLGKFSDFFDYNWLYVKYNQFFCYRDIAKRRELNGVQLLGASAYKKLERDFQAVSLRYTVVFLQGPLSAARRFPEYRSLGVPLHTWIKDAVATLFRFHRISVR